LPSCRVYQLPELVPLLQLLDELSDENDPELLELSNPLLPNDGEPIEIALDNAPSPVPTLNACCFSR